MLPDQVLNDHVQRVFAHGRVEYNLKALQELFDSLNRTMSQNQLHAILFQISLLNFTDDPLEVNDNDHLILMTLAPRKVKPAALELEDAISPRLYEVRVVNKLCEPLHPFLLRDRATVSKLIIDVIARTILLLLLLYLALAELDKFALQCLSDLHLREWLLPGPNLYVVSVHHGGRSYLSVGHVRLGKGARPIGGLLALRSTRGHELVAVHANATFSSFKFVIVVPKFLRRLARNRAGPFVANIMV